MPDATALSSLYVATSIDKDEGRH